MHYTTIDPKIQRFEPTCKTIDLLHHYTTLTSKGQIFDPKTMHCTTIDPPKKTKIRTQDHALHQYYTTIETNIAGKCNDNDFVQYHGLKPWICTNFMV
jgi:hypothetical protein